MDTTGQRAHRAEVYGTLRGNGLDCEDGTRSLEETAALYQAHRFVVDIYGANPQDFRVWEILALRAVPVVLRNPDQDDLFEGLPVVRVDSWEDLTLSFLENASKRLDAEEGDLAKAHLPYWIHALTRHFEVLDAPATTAATSAAGVAALAVAAVAAAALAATVRARAMRAATKVV